MHSVRSDCRPSQMWSRFVVLWCFRMLWKWTWKAHWSSQALTFSPRNLAASHYETDTCVTLGTLIVYAVLSWFTLLWYLFASLTIAYRLLATMCSAVVVFIVYSYYLSNVMIIDCRILSLWYWMLGVFSIWMQWYPLSPKSLWLMLILILGDDLS